MTSRIDRLRQKLAEQKLDAILISQAENRRYLSGFTGTSGILVISQRAAVLATDFRYTEQAEEQAADFEVLRIEGDFKTWLPELMGRLGVKRLGFEATVVTFAEYQRFKEAAAEVAGLGLSPTKDLVEDLRADKDREELRKIEAVVAITDEAFESVRKRMRPGMTEKQVAWELERALRDFGADGICFDVIVGSGPNAALPHAACSDRPIQASEPIVIDVGGKWAGYSADLSRTVCLGEPSETFNKVYDIVLGAQLTAIATISNGMTGEEADGLARVVIEQAGYGDAFGHGLGHGVGLAVHELPRLGKHSTDVLRPGMVFTIEPGIYLKGWGGVRIEDVVVLQETGVRTLTKAPKISVGGAE